MSGLLAACCCRPTIPPFTGCDTVCSATSAWWPEGAIKARLQASFSGVTIAPSTGPSFYHLQGVTEDDATWGLSFGTADWALGVTNSANYWPGFNNTSRPADFWRFGDDASCCVDFEPFNAARICAQAAATYGISSSWATGGATFGSEDSGVTATYDCQTRSEMGSCPSLTWTLGTWQAPPWAYPQCWTTNTVAASVNTLIIPGGTGTDGYAAVSFPLVGGVRKIRIEGYTAVSITITGANNHYSEVYQDSGGTCGIQSYGPTRPKAGCWKFMHWFFHESTPPNGFPCSQSSWSFENQLVAGYQPTSSTATWTIPAPSGTYCPAASTTSTTCSTPHAGAYNIGSGGSCTISLTTEGCDCAGDCSASPSTLHGTITIDGSPTSLTFTRIASDPCFYEAAFGDDRVWLEYVVVGGQGRYNARFLDFSWSDEIDAATFERACADDSETASDPRGTYTRTDSNDYGHSVSLVVST